MIAFGHNITAPFLPRTTATYDATLACIDATKSQQSLKTFERIITFDQNQGRDVQLSTDGTFHSNEASQMWCFEIKEVVMFQWSKGSTIIEYHDQENCTSELIAYWFLHTLLPIYLSIESNYELIHAGAVEINKKPVLFVAPSFGGKSTLTDFFIKKGHPMISDDRVPLFDKNSSIMAHSSYPYHRPYRKMEDLGKSVENFSTQANPVHIIYALEKVAADDTIRFKQLNGLETFTILQYSFDFNLPLNKVHSFELIAKIAKFVQVYRVSIPWDINRLEEVYHEICTHSNTRENPCY